jgi:hypothetical protein
MNTFDFDTDIQTAGELEKGLQELIGKKLEQLPPSERRKLAPGFSALAQPRESGEVLLFEVFNLLDLDDRFRMEQLLRRKDIAVQQTSIDWSPDGRMIYMMTLSVSPVVYEEIRGRYFDLMLPDAPSPIQDLWQTRLLRWLGIPV